jgi:hypothetical protein
MSLAQTDSAAASSIVATAQEVLPKFGLAYFVDDKDSTWAVTSSTPGPGIGALRIGQRVRLTIQPRPGFTVVGRYEPLS